MYSQFNEDLQEWLPTIGIVGAGLAFNVATYALDNVGLNFAINGCLAIAGIAIAAKKDEFKPLIASAVVAIGTLYGMSTTQNERKVCFTSPGEELINNVARDTHDLGPNVSYKEPNKIASRIIFETASLKPEGGTPLAYTTEPSLFSGLRDGGRVCPKVGRVAQRIFNSDGFDQTGAVEGIVSAWAQKYTP